MSDPAREKTTIWTVMPRRRGEWRRRGGKKGLFLGLHSDRYFYCIKRRIRLIFELQMSWEARNGDVPVLGTGQKNWDGSILTVSGRFMDLYEEKYIRQNDYNVLLIK